MVDTNKPIEVSPNTGFVDLLTAAGRYLTVIATTVPILLTLIGEGNLQGLIDFFQTQDWTELLAAAVGLGTLAYGLYKTYWRGEQTVKIAADPRTPDVVAKVR